MSEQLVVAVSGVVERGISVALRDAEFRNAIRTLAQVVLEETAVVEGQPGVVAESLSEHVARVAITPTDILPPASVKSTPELKVIQGADVLSPLPELTFGRQSLISTSPAISLPVAYSVLDEIDLSLTETRCRLKAEGARWAATRRRLMVEGVTFSTDIAPTDREIIARARAVPDCFLWMCNPHGPPPADLSLYENVAGCFDALADTISVLRQILDEPDLYRGEFENSLDLLAEAQSALGLAIAAIDGSRDSDLTLIFNWLKRTASENQIFIQRYMRIDDPAEPANWSNLSARIEAVDARVQEVRQRDRSRRKLLGKVRHKASLIGANPDNSEEWRTLIAAVNDVVGDGLPPSNRELRELLVPIIEHLPDELPDVAPEFQLVLREIDRFLATCPPPENAPVIQQNAETAEIAQRLRGRSIVLIGGERRPVSQQALKDAFGLKEVYWLEARDPSFTSFEPYVAKPDVAVVLLAIRWSRHSFAEVRGLCDQHQKPLVRLPGGYNPNQVAAQIMAQASERLASH